MFLSPFHFYFLVSLELRVSIDPRRAFIYLFSNAFMLLFCPFYIWFIVVYNGNGALGAGDTFLRQVQFICKKWHIFISITHIFFFPTAFPATSTQSKWLREVWAY
jgi:hypothetical protein